jgi:Putative MetA-pathway of phenol degradation
MKTLCLLVSFLFVSVNAQSQYLQIILQPPGPIVPDRPGQTNPPNVVESGTVQLETGFSRETDKADGIQTINYLYNTSLVRVGLMTNCELRLVVEYAGTRTDSSAQSSQMQGFNPVSVGTKIAICPEKGIIPQTAMNVAFTLPYVGRKEFRPTFLAPSFFLLMQNNLSEKLSLGYNLGLQWDGDQPNATLAYSISPSLTVAEGLSVYAEFYGFSTEKSVSDYRADMGFAYLMNDNVQIDISAGIGLNTVAPDSFVAFGLAWRFE